MQRDIKLAPFPHHLRHKPNLETEDKWECLVTGKHGEEKDVDEEVTVFEGDHQAVYEAKRSMRSVRTPGICR